MEVETTALGEIAAEVVIAPPREQMGDVYEVPEEDVEVIWDGVIESEEEDDESEEEEDDDE